MDECEIGQIDWWMDRQTDETNRQIVGCTSGCLWSPTEWLQPEVEDGRWTASSWRRSWPEREVPCTETTTMTRCTSLCNTSSEWRHGSGIRTCRQPGMLLGGCTVGPEPQDSALSDTRAGSYTAAARAASCPEHTQEQQKLSVHIEMSRPDSTCVV